MEELVEGIDPRKTTLPQDLKKTTYPAAFISTDGNNYNITYYVPIDEGVKNFQNQSLQQQIIDTEPPSTEKELNLPFLLDNKELFMASDFFDLSEHALAYLDNNRYKISYYVQLRDYYREKQEYDQKLYRYHSGDKEAFEEKPGDLLFSSQETSDLSAAALSEADGKRYKMSYYIELEKYNREVKEYNEKMRRFQAGDKDAFEGKPDSLLFHSKETSDLSAKALSEADGKKYKMSHYIEMERYHKESRQYDEKMLRFQAGDKEAFEDKPDPLMFYSKDRIDLSARGLSEADGKKHKKSYYAKLREYQIEREEYEKKLLLYHAGEKDIFERKEKDLVITDEYSLSAEALSYADGKRYKMSYYKDLERYHKEIQDYNRKLALHNAGHSEAFNEKSDPLMFHSKDRSDLSAEGLSEADGKKYKMSYYIKLKDYYKELEEYEIKKLLYDRGYDINQVGNKEVQFTGSDGFDENKSDREIWTPAFGDMISALNGRMAPYFMDNLFDTMRKVDGEFERKFAPPAIRVYMDCSTEIVSDDELYKALEKIC